MAEEMVQSGGKRSMVGGVLLLVAMALLIVALVTSWYTIAYSQSSSASGGSSLSGSINFSPDGQITVTQGSQSVSESFANSNSSATANLYDAVEATLILGLLSAGAGGALAIVAAFRPNARRWAVLLAILVVVLAVIGPIVLAAEQPSALTSDSHGAFGSSLGAGSSVSSPDNSFFGSQSAHNASVSWGPGIGWYLAFVAAGLGIVGAILAMTSRGEPSPEAETASADAPMSTPDSDDGTSPPMTVGASEGYICTKCQTRFDSVTEFQKHLREVH